LKYHETVERSAELLRQAVPMMSRQHAALHPVSYAVWYEYVARTNAGLRDAVDAHLRDHGVLDEAATLHLFSRHVAEVDAATASRVAEGFRRLLGDMSAQAMEAGASAERYGEALGRLSEALGDDAGDRGAAVSAAIDSTRTMQAAMAALQSHLGESQAEIERLREEVRRARAEATTDALTGLANRRSFDQHLAVCLAAQVPEPRRPAGDDAVRPCLLMGDIDHFKQINDTGGHAFGDQVLKAVGTVLNRLVPEQGLAARVGAEEFALFLPATTVTDARALGERVRDTLRAARVRRQGAEETLAKVTLSMGLAAHRPGESLSEFVQRADQALYASKANGRDCLSLA